MSLQAAIVSFFYKPTWGGPLNMKKYKLFPATQKSGTRWQRKTVFKEAKDISAIFKVSLHSNNSIFTTDLPRCQNTTGGL